MHRTTKSCSILLLYIDCICNNLQQDLADRRMANPMDPVLSHHTSQERQPACFPFIRSGQNHLARHSERGKKTRRTKEEVGRQHQGMDRPGVLQVPEGSGEQGKMEKTGCKIICGASMTLAVKELMMMMMTLYII